MPFDGILGTEGDPYDATRHGPICMQTNKSNSSLAQEDSEMFVDWLNRVIITEGFQVILFVYTVVSKQVIKYILQYEGNEPR